MSTPDSAVEARLAVRRADGETFGDDWSFLMADGDDPWKTLDGYEDDEDPVEYELVRLDMTVVERRTIGGPLGEPCVEWEGREIPARTTWHIYVPASGNTDEWPLHDAAIAWANSEGDAERIVNDLPMIFYVQHFGSSVTMIERDKLTIRSREFAGFVDRCTRCRHLREDHRPGGLSQVIAEAKARAEVTGGDREGGPLEAVVEEWLAQVADCDLGPNCTCVGHDDLLILQMEEALRERREANARIAGRRADRTLAQERAVRFDYYLNIAQERLSRDARFIATLIENGYENPYAVISDVREYLQGIHNGPDVDALSHRRTGAP